MSVYVGFRIHNFTECQAFDINQKRTSVEVLFRKYLKATLHLAVPKDILLTHNELLYLHYTVFSIHEGESNKNFNVR